MRAFTGVVQRSGVRSDFWVSDQWLKNSAAANEPHGYGGRPTGASARYSYLLVPLLSLFMIFFPFFFLSFTIRGT
jgi:hypothetical protein